MPTQLGTLFAPVAVTAQGAGPHSWHVPFTAATILTAARLVYADENGNRFLVQGSTAREWDPAGKRVLTVAEHLGGPRDGITVTVFLYPVGG